MRDDLRLAKDCLARRPGAWEELVERHAGSLADACRRTLRRRGRPSGDQEVADMVQRCLLALLEGDGRILASYEGRGPLGGFLAAVAVCRVLDDRTLRPTSGELPQVPDGGEAPTERIELAEELSRLREELARLPGRERLALRLQSEGAGLEQIGKVLGISREAAGQVVSRARAELRGRLTQTGNSGVKEAGPGPAGG